MPKLWVLHHILLDSEKARFQHGSCVVDHVVVRSGNVTSVRDVVLVSLPINLCGSNSLQFNDYVLLLCFKVRLITCTGSPPA